MSNPTTLKTARQQGKVEQFAADREADAPGDEAEFNRLFGSMAGTSKAVPEASTPPDCDD